MKKITDFFRLVWGHQTIGWRPHICGLIILLILFFIPTGFEDAKIYMNAEKVPAKVLRIDDSAIRDTGLIRSGEQMCLVRLESGKYKNRISWAVNFLSGSLSQDKEFAEGDRALVIVSGSGKEITSVTMIDHYRVGKEILLLAVFVALLIIFAGPGGIRAIMSFFITVLCLWKILIPYCLKGGNPLIIGIVMVTIITILIIMSVYGFDRRSMVAILGSMLGVITACIMGVVFTEVFNIHGAIMSDSESLIYSGYENLNLTRIFMTGIFIGASGAMMDLAVDITSGISEVVKKKPEISRLEAIGSGMRIGQAAMGTMTTTLLLAYAGGCISELMVFMAQGTPIINILNYKYVASEILKTMVGSFALVTVAPFTAVVGGFLLTETKRL